MVRRILCAVVLGIAVAPSVFAACDWKLCYDIEWMGYTQGGTNYCVEFSQPTGRIVWNDHQFGFNNNPTSSGGSTCLDVTYWSSCPALCVAAKVPQRLTGKSPGAVVVSSTTWNCWAC